MILIAYFLVEIKAVLVLIVLSFLFATIIEKPVNRLQSKHVPRAASILIIFAIIISVFAAATYFIAPSIADEADLFREEAPQSLRQLQSDWRASTNGLLSGPGADGMETLIVAIDHPPEIPREYAHGAGRRDYRWFHRDRDDFRDHLLLSDGETVHPTLDPDAVEPNLGASRRADLGGCRASARSLDAGPDQSDADRRDWHRPLRMDCSTCGFWPVLGLWAGITEAIPIIGPWIGGIPAVAMALTQSWQLAAIVAGVAITIQLTENWILVPRVMKGAVGLTPLTVFLAILVGTEFMGVVGALLAIPIAAAIQVIVSDLLRARRAQEGIPQTVSSWRWLGERLLPDRDPWLKTPTVGHRTADHGAAMDWSSAGDCASSGFFEVRCANTKVNARIRVSRELFERSNALIWAGLGFGGRISSSISSS